MKGVKFLVFNLLAWSTAISIWCITPEQRTYPLLVTYWNTSDLERRAEFERCFKENVANKCIGKIYVLYEKFDGNAPDFLVDPKIEVIAWPQQPTYKDFFDFANEHFKDQVVIVANTDIFFDDTLSYIEKLDFTREHLVLVLTRYNVPEYKGRWRRHVRSMDTWIFKTPMEYKDARYITGRPGCDLAMLDEWIAIGYNVSNPSLTVKTWHVHENDDRACRPNRRWLGVRYAFTPQSVPFTRI